MKGIDHWIETLKEKRAFVRKQPQEITVIRVTGEDIDELINIVSAAKEKKIG